MRLIHAMGLIAALLPAACAPGLEGFQSYDVPYAGLTPYAAAEPFYRPSPPPPTYTYPYAYGVTPGLGLGYYGYDRDRSRREWEVQRETRDAYLRDRERQEFERRRFEQARREEEFRRQHLGSEAFRYNVLPDVHRPDSHVSSPPPPVASPAPSRSLTPEQRNQVRQDVQRMFGIR